MVSYYNSQSRLTQQLQKDSPRDHAAVWNRSLWLHICATCTSHRSHVGCYETLFTLQLDSCLTGAHSAAIICPQFPHKWLKFFNLYLEENVWSEGAKSPLKWGGLLATRRECWWLISCCRCYFSPMRLQSWFWSRVSFPRTLLHPLLSWSSVRPLSVGYCRHHLYE